MVCGGKRANVNKSFDVKKILARRVFFHIKKWFPSRAGCTQSPKWLARQLRQRIFFEYQFDLVTEFNVLRHGPFLFVGDLLVRNEPDICQMRVAMSGLLHAIAEIVKRTIVPTRVPPFLHPCKSNSEFRGIQLLLAQHFCYRDLL